MRREEIDRRVIHVIASHPELVDDVPMEQLWREAATAPFHAQWGRLPLWISKVAKSVDRLAANRTIYVRRDHSAGGLIGLTRVRG
jgi:hypothetical protein